MMTLTCILAIAALISTILAKMGKCPIEVPVFLLACIETLRCLPLGR